MKSDEIAFEKILGHPLTDQTNTIPNDFHFVFGLKRQYNPFHLVHYLCLASCLAVNKPRKIFFHYHYLPYGKYWDMIRDRLELVPVELSPLVSDFHYKNSFLTRHFYRYAHHSDFIRMEALNRYGGVYADMDTLFVQPFPQEFFSNDFVIGREAPVCSPETGIFKSSLCNAIMMAKAQSDFGLRYAKDMAAAFDGYWSTHSCLLAEEIAKQFPESLHIEPEQSFYKHTWSIEGINTLLCGLDRNIEGVYSFHLWAHLWWSRFRRDISKFHAGLLTEDFIRTVDTTYTVFARQHLPPKKESCFKFFQKIPIPKLE